MPCFYQDLRGVSMLSHKTSGGPSQRLYVHMHLLWDLTILITKSEGQWHSSISREQDPRLLPHPAGSLLSSACAGLYDLV